MIGWTSFQMVGKENEYLQDALASGWVSDGPYVAKLETRVTEIFGGGTALAVANGTVALMLAFQVLDLQPGDRVVVPAFSFQAAANVLIQLGAEPVFCDVDPLSWNQSRASLEAVLDDTIKGVVVVHNYGAAAEIDSIAKLCKCRGIWLVEDAAEAWFTKYKDQYVGRFGDISTFSMHATKTIACGEGGMILVNRDDLVERAKLYRSHGLDRTQIQYKHVLAGNNYRLSNLLAAVGYAQIEQYEFIIGCQSIRTALYKQLLSDVHGLNFQQSLNGAKDEIWADAVILDPVITGIDRDDLLVQIKANGVDMRPGFYTPSTLDYYGKYDIGSTPTADHVAANIFVLPCSPSMTEAQIADVADKIKYAVTSQSVSGRTISVCDLEASNPKDLHNLQRFVNGLSSEESGFRYFDKRDFKVLENHITSLLVFNTDDPVGYGHLDRDGDTVWLGIAIHSEFTGKKLGHSIMRELLNRAAAAKIARVDLFVDHDNVVAQKLYLRYGFMIDKEGSNASAIRMFKTSYL